MDIARSGWIFAESNYSIKNMKLTEKYKNSSADYERIEQAIRFIEANFKDQPDLDDIASSVNLSKHHFHRLFKRWVGAHNS